MPLKTSNLICIEIWENQDTKPKLTFPPFMWLHIETNLIYLFYFDHIKVVFLKFALINIIYAIYKFLYYQFVPILSSYCVLSFKMNLLYSITIRLLKCSKIDSFLNTKESQFALYILENSTMAIDIICINMSEIQDTLVSQCLQVYRFL